MEFRGIIDFPAMLKIGISGVELVTLAIIVLYLIFSLVLIRRIRIMNLNLKTPYSKGFVVLAWLHTLASLFSAILVLSTLSIW